MHSYVDLYHNKTNSEKNKYQFELMEIYLNMKVLFDDESSEYLKKDFYQVFDMGRDWKYFVIIYLL